MSNAAGVYIVTLNNGLTISLIAHTREALI